MKNLVSVEFPAAAGKFDELQAMFKAILPDTRAFKGCISVSAFVEPGSNTISLIEDWESLEDYQAYTTWRIETGLIEKLDSLLEGGPAGLVVKQFGAAIDV